MIKDLWISYYRISTHLCVCICIHMYIYIYIYIYIYTYTCKGKGKVEDRVHRGLVAGHEALLELDVEGALVAYIITV